MASDQRSHVVPLLVWRFLLSKKSDGFVSFISWVSILGVSLGVLALTVVMSVVNGFEGELVRAVTTTYGSITLYSRGNPVQYGDEIIDKIRKTVPQTQAITASFMTELMAAGPSGVSGAVLEGFDLSTISEVTRIREAIVEGRFPEGMHEIAVGSSLAHRLGVRTGDSLRLVAPFVGNGDVNSGDLPPPKTIEVRVVGVIKLGMYQYDSKFMFATLPFVQSFLEQPGRVTSFRLKVPDGVDLHASAAALSDNFGYPFRAKDWSQLNKNLFYAIKLEKAVIGIILTVIIIVAAFNVVSTLMMMIHDKTQEIAILKAMGFRPEQGFMLFSCIGLLIGGVGVAIGMLGAFAVMELLRSTQWIHLPAEIYSIGFLPVEIRWYEVLGIAFSGVLICFLAAAYPAIQVSRRSPLEGIRQ